MHFEETPFQGLYLLEIERHEDERGFFARTWCCTEMETRKLNPVARQCSISFNVRKGTVRGMHFQVPPYAETKIVRCTRGAIQDVVVDLRQGSKTFKKIYSVELSAENRRMLYVPPGFAHGFQTLRDDTEVAYQMSEDFKAESAQGFRWDDEQFDVRWPLPVEVISEQDRTWPGYQPYKKTAQDLARIKGVSEELVRYYAGTFEKHGATPEGADWKDNQDHWTRYENMLKVVCGDTRKPFSVLDVGCGYGGLLDYARGKGLAPEYTGLDGAANLIEFASKKFPAADFVQGDILDYDPGHVFDYVVCNGILTQKLSSEREIMEDFAHALIHKMFALCRRGVAFNVMSSHVNFQVENLYYRNPADMMDYCLRHVTRWVKINHAYPMYEYTVYLYKEAV